MSKTKISIITITYNAAKYLEQTLDSVAEQGYSNLEYIVVDGGSTDNTMQLVRAREGLVTRWISEPDKGISDAFNKGIRMATGDIIGIINADDYYHPGALAAVARAVQEHPDADVYYGQAIHETFSGDSNFLFEPAHDVGKHIWSRLPLSHPATFVARKAYERFGLFGTQYLLAMDYDLFLRMIKGGADFCYVDEVLAHFRYGQARGTKGMKEVRDISISHGLHPARAYWYFGLAAFKAKTKSLLGM